MAHEVTITTDVPKELPKDNTDPKIMVEYPSLKSRSAFFCIKMIHTPIKLPNIPIISNFDILSLRIKNAKIAVQKGLVL